MGGDDWRMGTSDREGVRKRIHDRVWLESKRCEAVEQKKIKLVEFYTSDLLFYKKMTPKLSG